jgi:glucose-6-phosphate isomerase
MNTDHLQKPPQHIIIHTGLMDGRHVTQTQKTIGDLRHFFHDEAARANANQQQVLYRVQAHLPVADGTPGGLFFGTTWIQPGTIGDEYFMTKGHFHKLADRGEYYWGLQGNGVLILMDEQRNFRGEYMYPGSLHYIPGHTAHRVANIGDTELSFGACWPSDAGHNYEEIERNGFSCRLIRKEGKAQLVSAAERNPAVL